MTRKKSALWMIPLVLGLELRAPMVLAASARGQLCSAAGQRSGCIQDISIQGRPPSDPNLAAMQLTGNLMQSFTQSFINSLGEPPATQQKTLERDRAAQLERARKKKLLRTAWLAERLRDSPISRSPSGNSPRTGASGDPSLQDLVTKVIKRFMPKPTGDPILDGQPALRACLREGKCKEIGNVDKLGRQAFQQNGNTCEIAAQVQILKDVGRPIELKFKDGHVEKIDPVRATPQQMEDALFRYSQGKGYFPGERAINGTPYKYAGQILGDLGYTVKKESHQIWGLPDINDIPQALQKGHYVTVWVRGEDMWRQPAKTHIQHTVLVTGVVQQDGEVRGVYINDTGTPKETERKGFLVPADYFKTA